MRKRDVKQELQIYPCYEFRNGRLIRIPPPKSWYGVELHHYITTQWQQNNPEKFKEVEHLQKLIFLPPVMHRELHAKHSKFKEKYGIEIKELLYSTSQSVVTPTGLEVNCKKFDWREYMISADKARAKSDANSINLLRADIEKLINKAIEKGLHAAFKSGQIPQVLQDEVIAAGYDIEVNPTGMKIMWG